MSQLDRETLDALYAQGLPMPKLWPVVKLQKLPPLKFDDATLERFFRRAIAPEPQPAEQEPAMVSFTVTPLHTPITCTREEIDAAPRLPFTYWLTGRWP